MMNNIFNQFDPQSSLINPFILIIIPMLLLKSTNLKPNTSNPLKSLLLLQILKETKSNMNPNSNKLNNQILINILLSIATINLLALTPLAWSATAHLSMNLTTILPLWIPLMTMMISNKKKKFLTHLIPTGTPNTLIPFMFLIELTSSLIRPITLTMRLTANMIAGHILISLNSNLIMSSNLMNIIPSTLFILLNTMEMLVAILQAYIIATLLSMYISEL